MDESRRHPDAGPTRPSVRSAPDRERPVEGTTAAENERVGDGGSEHARADEVLDDRYRRRAVRRLRRADGSVPVADLARDVVAGTAGKPPDEVTLDERKRMYTALDRTHLPALAAVGLVERRAGDAVALADDPDDSDGLDRESDGPAGSADRPGVVGVAGAVGDAAESVGEGVEDAAESVEDGVDAAGDVVEASGDGVD